MLPQLIGRLHGWRRQAVISGLLPGIRQVLGDHATRNLYLNWFVAEPPAGKLRSNDILKGLVDRESQTKTDPHILKLLLDEFREELESGRDNIQGLEFYTQIPEKDELVRIAEEVLAKYPSSSNLAISVARLMRAVGHAPHRMEIMLAADRRKLLNAQGLALLATELIADHDDVRAEPVLKRLMKSDPNSLTHRARLLEFYSKRQMADEFDKLLAETESYFREHHLWDSDCLEKFAAIAMQTDRSDIALRYNQEQIQHDGPSDILYLRLAEAYSRQGKTDEAISAVVLPSISEIPS